MGSRWSASGNARRAERSPHAQAFAVTALLLLAGCTTTVDLDPDIPSPAPADRVPMAVGVYYAPAFRDYLYKTGETPRLGEYTVPLGKASVAMFGRILPGMFESVVEVKQKPTPDAPLAGLAAVIEPRIEKFDLEAHEFAAWRFWAAVEYRIVVHGPDGAERARWTVRGSGASRDKNAGIANGTLAETVERALALAATRLAASFRETPEAARWLAGQSTQTATADAARQAPLSPEIAGGYPIGGSYDGVLAVSLDPDRQPDFDSEGIEMDLKKAGARSYSVAIRNLGDRRLSFRRSDVALRFANGERLAAVPGGRLAAALTTRRRRINSFGNPGGVGGAAGIASAVVNLAVAFYNYAAWESEAAQGMVYGMVLEEEGLDDAVLAKGDRIDGFVHFRLPYHLREAPQAMTLVVPLVELDTVTRYVVSLPLVERSFAETGDVRE